MIMGLTDTTVIRRDGKIRAGKKNEKGFPMNLDHFLLHDAPQLIPHLGDAPKEIFFTVHADEIHKFFQDDLRWYSASELICKSVHNYVNPATKQPMGSVAAFFQVGQEVAGLSQQPFPGIQRSRIRNCQYKTCPNYVQGNQCSEHLFLDMIIPQYSMGSIFTLDSTSIYAVLNLMSALQKAQLRFQGKLSGQIFRLFKQKDQLNFQNPKDGKMNKRDTDIVHLESVSFSDYESRFREQIKSEDWDALMYVRSRQSSSSYTSVALPPADGQELLGPGSDYSPEVAPTTAPALTTTNPQADEAAILARANDPAVAPVFAEIALLTGKENTEINRVNTAKNFGDVAGMITYLKSKIKEAKKKTAAPAQPKAKPAVAPPPVSQPPPTASEAPLF